MEVELIEIRDFLAEHPPFDHLPTEALDALPKMLSVRYLRRGKAFPPEAETEPMLYMVRKGAVEIRDGEGKLVDRFGEGDICGFACGMATPDREVSGITLEDSLFYLLPCKRLEELRGSHEEFDRHFNDPLKKRIRRAADALRGDQGMMRLMATEVGQLLKRKPVVVAPAATIREAAQLMTKERVSAVLVSEGRSLLGIVTDRDLRRRCIAAGLDASASIREIMSERLVKISPDTPAFEALLIMTRENIHHIPVVARGGAAGLISNTDLIRNQTKNSLYLVGDIHKSETREDLERIGQQIPDLQIHMVQSGASSWHLGQAISSVTDALTERLIQLAQEELGEAPVTFSWLAVGSHARREQTCRSDQDHALLLADDYDEQQHGEYFARLADYVAEGLNRCGFFYCPGKVMATNPEWRQPARVWRGYFDDWIRRPQRRSLMLACNFFDMRPVAGPTYLYDQLRAEVLAQTQENRIFLAHMVANAMTNRPPLGFFRNLVLIHDGKHDNMVNLKHHGIIPIIDLARIFALSSGLHELNTVDRLRASAEVGAVSGEGLESLEDALEFIGILRAQNQVRQLQEGREVDNFLIPERLSKMERGHLKDAFSAIATMQSVFARRYRTELF